MSQQKWTNQCPNETGSYQLSINDEQPVFVFVDKFSEGVYRYYEHFSWILVDSVEKAKWKRHIHGLI